MKTDSANRPCGGGEAVCMRGPANQRTLSSVLAAGRRSCARARLVLKRASKVGGRYLMPLVLVVPVVVYAYVFQSFVTSHAEKHERETVAGNLDFTSVRLAELLRNDLKTCRDYAHWDDTYEQVVIKDRSWLHTNMDLGIAASYDFDMIALQDRTGHTVWSKGLNDAAQKDVRLQGLLRHSLSRGAVTGVFLIDGRIYSAVAVGIKHGDHSGEPRGMVFVARALSQQVLDGLAPGCGHRVVLCQTEGRSVVSDYLKPRLGAPPRIAGMAASGRDPRRSVIEVSEDGMRYYAALPLLDRNRKSLGALVVISPRASLVRTLRAIKQMSFTLMIVCALVGLAGISYLRVRELAVRARRDELTGLHNHGHLQQFLRNQIRIAQRYDRPLALMMLDIDHFKVFNDSHGHAAGDRVLQHVANVMLATTRDTDAVARYGGEEFVVIMPETDLAQALAGAERTRVAIERKRARSRDAAHANPEAADLGVTVSIGVASYPGDGHTAAELLAAADEALAAAKRTRNVVTAFADVVRDSPASVLSGTRLDGFLRDSTMSSIRPLIAAIDQRDANTASHSEKTAEYAVAIGRLLGLSTQQLALTCKAALLHDVGMIAIPDHLLVKTSPLTAEELEAIRKHVDLGTQTLMQSPLLAPVAEIVRCHHEHFDGSGYPEGLAGEAIPLIARVIAVADTLDALTSSRSYRPAMRISAAGDVLRRESGKQFDPMVVDAAVELVRGMEMHEAA